MKKVKPRLLGRLLKAATNFLYHYSRYVRYSGWRENMQDSEQRNYLLVKIYHSLEKSLSFKDRRTGAGIGNANYLELLLRKASTFLPKGFHDGVAPHVLQEFAKKSNGSYSCNIEVFDEFHGTGGTEFVSKEFLGRGVLSDPEGFFLSRHSLRDFEDKTIDRAVIERAISLAVRSPSVCNRQPWHVYYTQERKVIERALQFQNGNRGFGHRVPCLMIVTVDLKAFGPSVECYQHWIDGGIFSMSVIYALHSLEVASCCLNWSASPAQDKNFRRAINIKKNHSIIMLLAAGYSCENNVVCRSARRPVSEVLTGIDENLAVSS